MLRNLGRGFRERFPFIFVLFPFSAWRAAPGRVVLLSIHLIITCFESLTADVVNS